MRAVRETILEAAILFALTFAVAAGTNAVREAGSLKWTKNYFDMGEVPARKIASPNGDEGPAGPGSPGGDTAALAGEHLKHPKHPKHPKRLKHLYQELSFEQVAAAFKDPATKMGVNVFVDARNDRAFEKGHIPGALQCDHYKLEEYIQDILDRVYEAEKVIVYCNGGACADSAYVCKDLRDFDVPYESIYLYAGGWKEWTDNKMPVATGRDE